MEDISDYRIAICQRLARQYARDCTQVFGAADSTNHISDQALMTGYGHSVFADIAGCLKLYDWSYFKSPNAVRQNFKRLKQCTRHQIGDRLDCKQYLWSLGTDFC